MVPRLGFAANRPWYTSFMEHVHSNPSILGGTPCFSGTRVPVQTLFEHLRLGQTIEQFLAQFPSVTRVQADAVLEFAKRQIDAEARRVA